MNLPQVTQLIIRLWRYKPHYNPSYYSAFSSNGEGLGKRTGPWRNSHLSFRVLLVALSTLFLGFRWFRLWANLTCPLSLCPSVGWDD